MFAIQTLVGKKYGYWFTGSRRYTSHSIAQALIDRHAACERQCSATVMTRKIIEVSK